MPHEAVLGKTTSIWKPRWVLQRSAGSGIPPGPDHRGRGRLSTGRSETRQDVECPAIPEERRQSTASVSTNEKVTRWPQVPHAPRSQPTPSDPHPSPCPPRAQRTPAAGAIRHPPPRPMTPPQACLGVRGCAMSTTASAISRKLGAVHIPPRPTRPTRPTPGGLGPASRAGMMCSDATAPPRARTPRRWRALDPGPSRRRSRAPRRSPARPPLRVPPGRELSPTGCLLSGESTWCGKPNAGLQKFFLEKRRYTLSIKRFLPESLQSLVPRFWMLPWQSCSRIG